MSKSQRSIATLALVLAVGTAFAQPPTVQPSPRAKTLFSASETLAVASLNAYFGYTEANQPVLSAVHGYVAALNEPKLLAQVEKVQKACLKPCKSTLPPFRDLLKDFDKFQKKSAPDDASYISMGTAAGGAEFYYQHAAALHEALRASVRRTVRAQLDGMADYCTENQGCPAAVQTAFRQLLDAIEHPNTTPEQVQPALDTIRQALHTATP